MAADDSHAGHDIALDKVGHGEFRCHLFRGRRSRAFPHAVALLHSFAYEAGAGGIYRHRLAGSQVRHGVLGRSDDLVASAVVPAGRQRAAQRRRRHREGRALDIRDRARKRLHRRAARLLHRLRQDRLPHPRHDLSRRHGTAAPLFPQGQRGGGVLRARRCWPPHRRPTRASGTSTRPAPSWKKSSPSSPTIPGRRITSSTASTTRRWPRTRCWRRAVTRASRPRCRTPCICRRTSSPAWGCGRIPSTPTWRRNRQPSNWPKPGTCRVRQTSNCTPWTT